MARKKRGAPEGNQNARKHGFYAIAMSEAEKLDLETAVDIDGLDAEIAVLRVKLKQLLENSPDRVDLHFKAARMLANLVRIEYSITPEEKNSLKDAITNVLTEVALPLGLKFIP